MRKNRRIHIEEVLIDRMEKKNRKTSEEKTA